MKRAVLVLAVAMVMVGMLAVPAFAAPADKAITIQDGVLTYSEGHYLEDEFLTVGFDAYGYNYQAHMFKGSYANAYLGGAGFPPYEGDTDTYLEENPGAESLWFWGYQDVQLTMKWNDAWLSNTDADDNGALDRDLSPGSGAWTTNHMAGVEDGQKWTYFTKIVTPPADAVKTNGVWYTIDGIEIGPAIWGSFATVQEVQSGMGAYYVSPSGPSLGKW
ncbi:MAG TPA: hypothetical protein VFE20_07580 [Thermoleophilia bacterium]|nr:hypothetical protein [Thermoleophilia bacterium]